MLTFNQLGMRFGGKILFKQVQLQLQPGGHYGLVGANGAGKSTFLKMICQEVSQDAGDILIPNGLRIGTMQQDHFNYENEPVLEVVLRGRPRWWAAWRKREELLKREHFTTEECHLLEKLEQEMSQDGGTSVEYEAAKLLEGLGIGRERHHGPMRLLSGGYKLRALLAQALFGSPDILVLDEPTNHLDLHSIRWLESYLKRFSGMLIVSSHDRDFLNGISTHILDLDYQTITAYSGNFDAYEQQKLFAQEQRLNALEKQEQKRQELQTFIDRFRYKSSKARQAQSRLRWMERLEEERESLHLAPSSRMYPHISFNQKRASGVLPLKVLKLDKSYGEKQVLHDVTFEIERGERVALVGVNGIGKSTLLEIVTGHQPADKGSYQWGPQSQFVYFPQDPRRDMPLEKSMLEWIRGLDPLLQEEQCRQVLGAMLFSGDTVYQAIGTLSGGETARLQLAKMMILQPNILLFDEPTNHLDMEAIEALLEALEDYPGTVLFVSHNRYFVSKLATRVLELTAQGLRDYRGDYKSYIAQVESDPLQVAVSKRESSTADGAAQEKYEARRQQKRAKSQLERQRQKAEERCFKLEEQLAQVHERLAVDGFYQTASLKEQQEVLQQKERFEQELNEAMQAWEEIEKMLLEE